MDKPTFIKTHPNDLPERMFNVNHIVEIKLSDDEHHASVKMVGDDSFIRTNVLYSKLKEYIDIK